MSKVKTALVLAMFVAGIFIGWFMVFWSIFYELHSK